MGVIDTAVALCEKYGIDTEKAELAALFHDYAKEWTKEEALEFFERSSVNLTELELRSPQLWHAKVAQRIAKEEYGIEDEDVLNAIRYHTTCRAGMSDLEIVIALADYIEPSRSYPGVEELRRAEKDLGMREALLQGLNHTIEYLLKEDQLIHPDTLEARNDLILSRKQAEGK
ncbi:MAG: bis(5'-nucleosyl)-tetraphosphatase (symmetrical) YqeK, partial [Filifactor alocis]|nr:bis(5'-nucleosyl)-tetraphosphatase (symmetrical) YqeK [Filifactor alocis]